jgi:hypothetical protein
MKTALAKREWVIPLLGIVLVVGTWMAATSYCDLEQRAHDAEALGTTLGRLYQDHQLSVALKDIRAGDLKEASRRMDAILCSDILRIDEELPSADPRARGFIEDAFRKMAAVRPKTAGERASGSAQEIPDTQAAVERILNRFLTSPQTAQVR